MSNKQRSSRKKPSRKSLKPSVERSDTPGAAARRGAATPRKETSASAESGTRSGSPGSGDRALGQRELEAPTGPDRVYAFADQVRDLEAVEEPQAEEPEETWITFRLTGETFAFPVGAIDEVLRVQSVTRVPHAPYPVRGITNHRGRVLPVVDLRLRLFLDQADLSRSSRILVTRSRARFIGLLVDTVLQLVQIRPSAISPPPDDVMTEQSYYLRGVCDVDKELLILLDVERILEIRDDTSTAASA
jgi:purine-binding chemotaxis protein CheW